MGQQTCAGNALGNHLFGNRRDLNTKLFALAAGILKAYMLNHMHLGRRHVQCFSHDLTDFDKKETFGCNQFRLRQSIFNTNPL